VKLSNLDISVGDDIIAIKSGFPIDPSDPQQRGLPRMATSNVRVTNIIAGDGHGISIGSEAANGVNNVTIQNVHFTRTSNGIRIKTARDRGSQIYGITAKDLVMTDVGAPIGVGTYYPAGSPREPPYGPAERITPTTPYVHNIVIENLVATGAKTRSIIHGLPESCVRDVTLKNVSIDGPGLGLRHMTGVFADVTITPAAANPPFVVEENVSVITNGATLSIPPTPPQAGQIACSAQVVPTVAGAAAERHH
jgi:polygalacturonase